MWWSHSNALKAKEQLVNMKMWGMPIALGVATSIGLISALLGDGLWDAVSAVTLGAPVAACAWYALRRT